MNRNAPIPSGEIAILKRRIVTDSDLSSFWDYYFTNFAERPSFKEMGKPCRNKTIEEILGLIGRQVFRKDPIVLNDLLLLEIEEFELVHGCCLMEGRVTAVVYFPKLETGVVSIVTGKGAQMIYARITPAHLARMKAASDKIQ